MEHTPTPWNEDGRAVVGPRPEQEICVCTADKDIPKEEAYANTAFIVRACNAHDSLTAENEALKAEVKRLREKAALEEANADSNADEAGILENIQADLVKELDAALWALEHPEAQIQRQAAIVGVRAALAKAKG